MRNVPASLAHRATRWLALSFAYMVLITVICLVASTDVVRYRVLTFALNGGMSEWNNSYDSQEWSSRHDLIIRLMETGAGTANYSKLIVLDPATGQAYQPTQTGTPPAATGL